MVHLLPHQSLSGVSAFGGSATRLETKPCREGNYTQHYREDQGSYFTVLVTDEKLVISHEGVFEL
jgi:hypothetical protein